MKKFKQLTLKKRYQISPYKEAGYTQKYIANLLGVAESTISRELQRNSLEGQKKADWIHSRQTQQQTEKAPCFKTPAQVFMLEFQK